MIRPLRARARATPASCWPSWARRRPARRRSPWSWPSGSAARSSAPTACRSTAASTSGSGKPTAGSSRARRITSWATLDPLEHVDAAAWAERASQAIDDVRARGRVPIVCGGTFLWVKALLFGLAEAPAASAELRAAHRARSPSARGARRCTRGCARSIPTARARLHPNDFVRVSRALEVLRADGQADERVADASTAFRARPAPRAPRGHRVRPRRADRAHPARACGAGSRRDGSRRWRRCVARGYGEARAMGSVGYAQVRAMLAGELPRGRARGGDRARDARVRAAAAHVAQSRGRRVARVT